MNDEYLWDKSGDPDSDIQQLEEVLGKLKYQPRPLEIPRNLVVARRRSYVPYLAIAASIVIALLATGFWLIRVRESKERPSEQVRVKQPIPTPTKTIDAQQNQPVIEKETVAVAERPARKKTANRTRLTAREREEALVAKQQLLLALRLASEKLNLAQKRTVSPSPATQIRNQHKVG